MDSDLDLVRAHGFERPLHLLQVTSWFVFGADALCYCFFCLPLVESVGAKIAVATAYVTSTLSLVTFAAMATRCDPSDPHLRCIDETGDKPGDENLPYCNKCNVPVNCRSKHCRACNRCVDEFDHHCIWLNNCVGRANYRWFFCTIVSLAVMISVTLGTCTFLFVDSFADEDGFERRIHDTSIYEYLPKGFFVGIFAAMVFVNVPLFVLDMHLVVLHLFLISQNVTTYEYIIGKAEATRKEKPMLTGKSDKADKSKIRTLPCFMDWIIFCRWCQKRDRKQEKQSFKEIESVAHETET